MVRLFPLSLVDGLTALATVNGPLGRPYLSLGSSYKSILEAAVRLRKKRHLVKEGRQQVHEYRSDFL